MVDDALRKKKIEEAESIVAAAKYANLIDYAAKEIDWGPASNSHAGGGKYVADPYHLSAQQKCVLDALKQQHKIKSLSGYYGNQYVPEPTLEQAIDTHLAEPILATQKERRNEAFRQLYYSPYTTISELVAAEIKWRPCRNNPHLFVVEHEDLSSEQAILLQSYQEQGGPITRTTGYRRNDWIARGELAETLGQMELNVRSFAEEVSKVRKDFTHSK